MRGRACTLALFFLLLLLTRTRAALSPHGASACSEAGRGRNEDGPPTALATPQRATDTSTIPNSYMVPSMAEFHRGHPDLTRRGKPLDLEAWDAKLDATVRYLRGELTTCDSVRS